MRTGITHLSAGALYLVRNRNIEAPCPEWPTEGSGNISRIFRSLIRDAEFEKKVVLVTGGSIGIGRATAIAFAKEGAIVAIASRHEEKAKDLVAEVRDICEEASFVRTDVSCEPDVCALVTDIIARFGRLDCAFNNAGAESTIAPFHDQTLDDFDKVIDVDLSGTFLA